MSDDPVDLEAVDDQEPKKSKVRWIVASAAVVLVIVLIAVLTRGGGKSTDAKYLDALGAAGQRSNFPADRAALSNAHRICDSIDNGGKDQGSEADKIGVQFYCKEYVAAFKVLRTTHVRGTLTLIDFKTATNGCSGTGGYSDINSSTPVVVKGANGNELVRTDLGTASHDTLSCTWTFIFDVTEGEDRYVVSVGHRGDFSYTFDELATPFRIALSL